MNLTCLFFYLTIENTLIHQHHPITAFRLMDAMANLPIKHEMDNYVKKKCTNCSD